MRGFKKPSRLAQKEGVYESSTIETKYKNLKKKEPDEGLFLFAWDSFSYLPPLLIGFSKNNPPFRGLTT